MNTLTWYAETTKGDATNAVATKAGLVTTTLARQLERQNLTAETVAAIAVAYDRDVLDALVIAGLITREQIKRHGVQAALAQATDRELADEVWQRMSAGHTDEQFGDAVSEGYGNLRAVAKDTGESPHREQDESDGR